MKKAARRDGSVLHSRFSNSFTIPFGLGLGNPLGDESSDDTESAEDIHDADDRSETSHSSDGDSAGEALRVRVDGWQYWLFGGGAHRDHHHSLNRAHSHSYRGDIMPADLKLELMNITTEDMELHEQPHHQQYGWGASSSGDTNDPPRPLSGISVFPGDENV
jgi:hypothetical protein